MNPMTRMNDIVDTYELRGGGHLQGCATFISKSRTLPPKLRTFCSKLRNLVFLIFLTRLPFHVLKTILRSTLFLAAFNSHLAIVKQLLNDKG